LAATSAAKQRSAIRMPLRIVVEVNVLLVLEVRVELFGGLLLEEDD